MEGLEHEAHVPAPQQGQRVVVERRKVLSCDRHRSRVGVVEAGDDVEECRLAGAGFTEDRDHLAGCDGQRDFANTTRGRGPANDFRDASKLDQRPERATAAKAAW